MSGIRQLGHVLVYPPRGTLLFATDFHGHWEDFQAVVATYESLRARASQPVYLLFAGDFVHGPSYTPEEWPDWRADTYHADETPAIVEALETLLARDSHVRSLLGNHEHAHIGGPRTDKFHQSPDEVAWLEGVLGPERTARLHAMVRRFSLVALTPCGVLLMHAAPAVRTAGLAEVSSVALDGYAHLGIREIYDVPIIGELLWAKSADAQVAEQFLERMRFEDMRPRVAVYGHDVIEEGYEIVASNQVIVSTSFGVPRENKTLCVLDLGAQYESAHALRPWRELVALHGS